MESPADTVYFLFVPLIALFLGPSILAIGGIEFSTITGANSGAGLGTVCTYAQKADNTSDVNKMPDLSHGRLSLLTGVLNSSNIEDRRSLVNLNYASPRKARS